MKLKVDFYKMNSKCGSHLSVSQMILKNILNEKIPLNELKILSLDGDELHGLSEILTVFGLKFEIVFILTIKPINVTASNYFADRIEEREQIPLIVEEFIRNQKTPVISFIDVFELNKYFYNNYRSHAYSLEKNIMPQHFRDNSLHCILIYGFDDTFFYIYDPAIGQFSYEKEMIKYIIHYLYMLI